MDVDAALMVSVLTLDAESQPADALDEIHDILEDVLPDSLDDFDDADTQQDGNDVVEEVQPDAVDLRAVLERAASTSQAHADSWASGAWTSAASSPELQAAFEQLIQVCSTSDRTAPQRADALLEPSACSAWAGRSCAADGDHAAADSERRAAV